MDNRFIELAKNLVSYSCDVQKGERVLISCNGTAAFPLVKAIIREVYNVGAYPYVELKSNIIQRELLMGCSKEQFDEVKELDNARMALMDCYIGIGCKKLRYG